jgi:hypothetical protein
VTKATNHDVVVPKQKHVVTLYNAAGRADSPKDIIRYVLGRLSDRVTGSSEWLVVLKSLMVVHRLMREAEGDLFRKVLADGLFGDRKAGRGGDGDRFRSLAPPGPGLALFSLSGWKDDSTPEAWEQSAWVKAYAAYLEERCSVFSDTGCDPQAEPTNAPSAARNWNAPQLLVGLPKLQVLLRRLVDTLPKVPRLHAVTAAAAVDCVREVRLLFRAVSEALLNLVDKFFDMPPSEATAALDMYRRAVRHVHDLNAALSSLRSHEQLAAEMTRVPMPFEPPPPEFQKVMEEYINTGGWANSSASAQQQMSQAQQFARSSQQGQPARQASNGGDSSPPVYQLDMATHVNTTGVPMPPPRRSAAVVDDLFGGPAAGQGSGADPFAAMQPAQPQHQQGGGVDLFGALAPVAAPATQAPPPRPALNLDALYSSAPVPPMQMGGAAPYGGAPNPFGMPGMQQPGMMMGGMQQQQPGALFSAYGMPPMQGGAPPMMGYGAPQNGANPMMMGQQQQPGMMTYPGMSAAPPSMYPGQQQQMPAYGARPPQFGAPAGGAVDPFSSYGAPAGGGFGGAPNGGFGGAMPQPPAPAADPFSGLSGLGSAPQPARPASASNPFA